MNHNLTSTHGPKFHIKGLDFYYGPARALKDVSIDIWDRQTTAIIGPSGCGKSTLLRVLNRIYDIYPGQKATGLVQLDGESILDQDYPIARLRAKVGMVFQKPTPFLMSIYDNIAFAIKHHEGLSKQDLDTRVEKSLRQAALWDEVKDKLKKSAVSLSGGQQQRLCIARTIAINPEVLLLDEPTSALDPISTAKIEELLQELQRDFCVVIVTHNMQQANRISKRCAFMHLGQLIEVDDTKTIFGQPQNKLTESYVTGHFG